MRYLMRGVAAAAVLGMLVGGATTYHWAAGSGSAELPEAIQRHSGYFSQIGKRDLDLGGQPIQRAGDKLVFNARKDSSPWLLELPLDWNADPFRDVNWRFQLHAWRMIDLPLNDYFATQSNECLREAFSYARDWFNYHYESRRETSMSWQDMAPGIRAMKIALFLDAYHAGWLELLPEDVRRLMWLVDEHAHRLQDTGFIADNNHGLFQVFGLSLLCKVAADRKPCSGGQEFASKMFASLVRGQFTDEGVHRENSPDYHELIRRVINKLGGPKRFDNAKAAELLAKAAAVEPKPLPSSHG